MRTPYQKLSGGFALIATMSCLVVILIVFAGVMYWISTNGKQALRNQTYMASEAAAEAATEMAFAEMDRDFLYQSLNSASFYESLYPNTNGWPVPYTFNISVTLGATNGNLQYLDNQFTNLMGYPETNTITATATPLGQTFNVPATVSQQIVFASVPAFQFAIFYNIDLDMAPGDPMTIEGATFCNANIWCYPSAQMTFNGSVEAAGEYFFHWDTNGDESGNIADPAVEPIFNDGDPLSHANPLVLPIGADYSSAENNATNVEAIINIPPQAACAPQTVAYTLTNQVYAFNAASLIVSNWSTGLNQTNPYGMNFTVYLQDISPGTASAIPKSQYWTQLTNDYYVYSNNYYYYYYTNYYYTNSGSGSSGSGGGYGGGYGGGKGGSGSGSGSGSSSLSWTNESEWMFSTNYVPNFQFTNNFAAMPSWTNPGQPGTNYLWYAGFSFLTNVSFTDYRESATVQAVQIDVSLLRAWILTNSMYGGSNWSACLAEDMDKGINSMFVYNDAPFVGQSQLPAVSVVNGSLLPNSTNIVNNTNCVTSGLTVVTPQPLYVIGHYNVGIDGHTNTFLTTSNLSYTYPAAFMADAITVLSSNWPSKWDNSLGSRTAANITVNAACLEGIVPSTGGQTDDGDGKDAEYSGGLENFLRLLEDWSGYTVTYNGSIMVMFPSVYATNCWQMPGEYYDVPNRVWGFDTNFEIQADLPPLTPQFRAVIRNSWGSY